MCGISGEVRLDGARADAPAVARMTDSMRSRGPDGAGMWHGGWVALGHRRLSIIDLSGAGSQPMVDEARGLALVFNGCIYNHEALREELMTSWRFRSTSDTEVVLAAYARWAEDFVDHLTGMFAVAVVDQSRRQIVLARDRLGIKPLYLAPSPGRLRFASTLPALLAAGEVDTDIDRVGLHHYLSWHSIVPAPRTVLAGVQKLPPATVRVLSADGRSRDRVYWEPAYVRDPARSGMSAEDWRDALRGALTTAVRRRTVADVPVGVLLSGGLDSSIITALLAREGQRGLATFSIGFADAGGQSGDEFRYSDAVARGYGTEHHRIRIAEDRLVPAVDAAVEALTEPIATHDVVAFFLLSQEVSQYVKVVQSGQGADEVLAGYAYHQPCRSAPLCAAPQVFRDAFVDRSHDELTDLLQPEYRLGSDVSGELAARNLLAPGAETALDAMLRFDTHVLMPDDPVKRVDTMTMAWGLEARVPFLDADLVELAAACPPELKASQGGKGILKDIGREVLPAEVVDRPKGYFPVPALTHLDGELLERARDALYAPAAKQRGLFGGDHIDKLLAAPVQHRTRVGGTALWPLALLELWLQAHGVT